METPVPATGATDLQSTTDLLVGLHQKIDHLSCRVDDLYRRQQALDELKEDLTPVINDVYRLLVDELAQIDAHLTLDEVLQFFRKLLRNVDTFSAMIDQAKSVHELLNDVAPLGKDLFSSTVAQLDALERRNVFAFLAELLDLSNSVLDSFTPDDVRQLGEHVVLILNTVKNMTQPEILSLVNDGLSVVRQDKPVRPVGLMGLVKATREPEIQRGIGILMQTLRELAKTENGRHAVQNA